MKLAVNITGQNGIQDCSVHADGTLMDVTKMVMTVILELHLEIQESNGGKAADLFRKAINEATQETFFDMLSAAHKSDTAVPMAAPGYIHVPTQK